MRICDLTTGAGQLQKASTRLKEVWLETKETWKDGRRARFQEEHLEPLAPQITLTVASIHRFLEVINKAQSDLLDESEHRGI